MVKSLIATHDGFEIFEMPLGIEADSDIEITVEDTDIRFVVQRGENWLQEAVSEAIKRIISMEWKRNPREKAVESGIISVFNMSTLDRPDRSYPTISVTDAKTSKNDERHAMASDSYFFQRLAALGNVDITMRIYKFEGSLMVNIIPGNRSRFLKPMNFKGTPEQFDKEFFNQILDDVTAVSGGITSTITDKYKNKKDSKADETEVDGDVDEKAEAKPAKKKSSTAKPAKKPAKKPKPPVKKVKTVKKEAPKKPAKPAKPAKESTAPAAAEPAAPITEPSLFD
jgi:hypothetical protein